jgi:hypothetical protein
MQHVLTMMELHHVHVSQDTLVTEICVPILMSAQRRPTIVMQMLPALTTMAPLHVPVTKDTLETAHTALTLMNVTLLHHHTTAPYMEPVLTTTAHSRALVTKDTLEMELFA